MTATQAAEQRAALDQEDLAMRELGRYFQVAEAHHAATGGVSRMPACLVDQAWHELLNDALALQVVIEGSLGEGATVDHVPASGYGVIEWVGLYEEMFGELPVIWFTAADGTVDTQALERYLAGGPVILKWDCGDRDGI
jgi:hypothetical protein